MIYLRWPMGPAIREHDSERRLIATGYQWDEHSHAQLLLAVATAVSAFYLCIVNYPIHGLKGALPFAATVSVSTWAVLWMWFQRRTVMFHRDGAVLTPYGRPNKLGARRLRIHHASIASIEVTNECDGNGVAIYSVEGDTYIVGHRLRAPDARLVAVQLTKALRDMRESLATVHSAQSAFAEAHTERPLRDLLEEEFARQSAARSAH